MAKTLKKRGPLLPSLRAWMRFNYPFTEPEDAVLYACKCSAKDDIFSLLKYPDLLTAPSLSLPFFYYGHLTFFLQHRLSYPLFKDTLAIFLPFPSFFSLPSSSFRDEIYPIFSSILSRLRFLIAQTFH